MTATHAAETASTVDAKPVLEVSNLAVEFRAGKKWTRVVDDVSFQVREGEVFGLVGESGSGKTVTSLAIMGLAGANSRVADGQVLLEGRDILKADPAELSDLRGNSIAMVFQEPMRSLNPAFTVGDQIAEAVRRHRPDLTRAQAWARAVEMLQLVEIPRAAERAKAYPHQLSGGMCQRVMIAMALSCDPKVLIADEPTTALDVTAQAQILRMILALRDKIGIGVLLITHDLGVVAETCDRAAVMYAGEVVEQGPTERLFASPEHPYTAGLLAAIPSARHRATELVSIPGRVPPPTEWPTGCRFAPRCSHAQDRCRSGAVGIEPVAPGHLARCVRSDELELAPFGAPAAPLDAAPSQPEADAPPPSELVTASSLMKTFSLRRNWRGQVVSQHIAVNDVSVSVRTGETLVIVGESGAGKSTLGRMLLRLEEPDGGTISFDGVPLEGHSRRRLRAWRSEAQMIFQDPFNSLDPRVTVLASLMEPMKVHGISDDAGRRARALELLERVGLSREHAGRFPYEFSGGQLQRIAIARALTTDPKLIVCDEPVAALDMSIRAQVINLLRDLQQERQLSYVFITHDLSLVRVIAHRVMVMYQGRVVEVADGDRLFDDPQHPYTRRLLDAIPVPDPTKRRLVDLPPITVNEAFPAHVEQGCPYARFCPSAMPRCGEESPPPVRRGDSVVACHLYSEPGAGVAGAHAHRVGLADVPLQA